VKFRGVSTIMGQFLSGQLQEGHPPAILMEME
jgi:hypothetical protein